GQVLPSWVIDAVCVVPNGPHPSYADGYSERDNAFYAAWDPISRDRKAFEAWIDEHVRGTAEHAAHLASIGREPSRA
ncbi:MAG: CoA transferase subunit A, partial [Actinomycetota bacterium]